MTMQAKMRRHATQQGTLHFPENNQVISMLLWVFSNELPNFRGYFLHDKELNYSIRKDIFSSIIQKVSHGLNYPVTRQACLHAHILLSWIKYLLYVLRKRTIVAVINYCYYHYYWPVRRNVISKCELISLFTKGSGNLRS